MGGHRAPPLRSHLLPFFPLDLHILFAYIATVCQHFNFSQEVIMLSAGDVAPDFLVKDHTGKEVKLSDYRGKTVVLWFYPRASTGG